MTAASERCAFYAAAVFILLVGGIAIGFDAVLLYRGSLKTEHGLIFYGWALWLLVLVFYGMRRKMDSLTPERRANLEQEVARESCLNLGHASRYEKDI